MNIRKNNRYSHIYIGLKINMEPSWEPVKALDWNENGFNFHIDRSIDTDSVIFRKGMIRFPGTIIWRMDFHDDHVILEMVLNRFLFEELGKINAASDNYRRIVSLIRTQGKHEEKEKLLFVLKGISIVDYALSLVEKYKTEKSLYRYGVKVISEEWAGIVQYALQTSSVVQALDKIGTGLSRINEEIQ